MQSQDKTWLNQDTLKAAEVNCSRGGSPGFPEINPLSGLNFPQICLNFFRRAVPGVTAGWPELSLQACPGVPAGWYELSRRPASVSRHACLNLPAELPVLHCKAVRTFAKTCRRLALTAIRERARSMLPPSGSQEVRDDFVPGNPDPGHAGSPDPLQPQQGVLKGHALAWLKAQAPGTGEIGVRGRLDMFDLI